MNMITALSFIHGIYYCVFGTLAKSFRIVSFSALPIKFCSVTVCHKMYIPNLMALAFEVGNACGGLVHFLDTEQRWVQAMRF